MWPDVDLALSVLSATDWSLTLVTETVPVTGALRMPNRICTDLNLLACKLHFGLDGVRDR